MATVPTNNAFDAENQDLIALDKIASLAVDLRYAGPNNFMGYNVYGAFNKAYLHKIAAEKLLVAINKLRDIQPDYQLLILDALRPRSVQYAFWEKVKGTEQEKYIADPAIGSMHNFGLAVDLTIINDSKIELDMGTKFDDFSNLAQPKLEEVFLQMGKLSTQQIKNRHLLRDVMEGAGFIQLPIEWWHFDALPSAEVRGRFNIVE